MLRKNKIWPALALFLMVYVISLLAWVQIKPFYGQMLSHIAARVAVFHTGFKVKTIVQQADETRITFSRTVIKKQGIGEFLMDIRIKVSSYSFNVPLTLAIIAALYPLFGWRKKNIPEILIILIGIHLLYIYSFCVLRLFETMTQAGMTTTSSAFQFMLQFLWGFTDNLVIRFEPFLLAAYLWLRNQPLQPRKP